MAKPGEDDAGVGTEFGRRRLDAGSVMGESVGESEGGERHSETALDT
jgi:hypothetical protein